MSEEIKIDARRKVTSVGNSWIICKSKSHPGYIYYFNTLTGEAAWNLSDAEIEKAKLRTKNLDPGAKPTKCPEPKDKPPQSISSEQFVRISEQQSSVMTYSNVANNNTSFSSPFNQITGVLHNTPIRNPAIIEPISNFNTLNAYNFNSTQTVYNPKVWAVPFTQQILIGPGPAPVVNHSLGSVNVAYNQLPSVSQPATSLFFNSSENRNQSNVVLNGAQTFYHRDFNHDQGLSKKTGFTNVNDLRQKLSFKKRFQRKSNIPGETGFQKANPRNTDTAAYIANKYEGIHSNGANTGLEDRCADSQLHEPPSKIDLDPLKSLAPPDSNSDAWFIVIDLEVLLREFKFLTTLTDSDEKCHLMVPKRVMDELKNYVTLTENIQAKRILRFLSQYIEIGYAFLAEEPSKVEDDTLVEAIHKTCKELQDNQYHLVLLTNDNELITKCSSNINTFNIEEVKNFLKENPHKQVASSGPKKPFVVDELPYKHVASSGPKKPFVVDELPYKHVASSGPKKPFVVDELPYKHVASSGPKKPFVVDELPYKHVASSGPKKPFVVDELPYKHVASSGPKKPFVVDELPHKHLASSGPKKPFMVDELLNKIKITVPNDALQKVTTISPVSVTKSDDIDNIPETPTKQKNNPDEAEKLIKLKHTVDAGIQTDLEGVNASISMTNVVEEQHRNSDSNILLKNTKEANTENASLLVPNILDKKREIKLKRSISHQPVANSVESQQKQFKWRRRRNTSHQCQANELIPSHTDQNMNTKNVESLETNTLSNEISVMKLPDTILYDNNPKLGRVENKISEDSIESRESSIYAEPRNSTTKENITIDETSTSGIISNSESNVDVDSNYSNSTNSVQQQFAYNRQPNIPMYEVDSDSMEQYLLTKCDEWISRFIQIMEEVLSQVLQQEPPFVHDAMPPPWTLHEATQCITIKFRGHHGIIAAANKLTKILFQVSDRKGKISMNMKPYQYMQMYSYGVHLLAAMKVATSCEDIEIAVDSLNKLIHDIRNPNIDSSTTDTFNDNRDDDISNNDVSAVNSDVMENTDDGSLYEQEMLPDCNQAEEAEKTKENPKKRKLSEEEDLRPVKFIRNFNVPFPIPKSFNVQKSMLNTVRSPVKTCEEQLSTHSDIEKQANQQNVDNITENDADSDVPTNQPNIIRQFSLCPKLEEKLKLNNKPKIYTHEKLNFNECYGRYMSENFYSEVDSYEEQHNDVNENQTDEASEDTNEFDPKRFKDDNSLLKDENSKKFKYIMHELIQEIKSALSQVQILCDHFYKKLKNPDQSTKLKCELQKLAERAQLHTIRLCRSLESMLDHETGDPSQSISALLEQADINIRHVDANLLFEYRISIENCKNCADEFLRSIRNVVSEIKRNV